MPSYFIRLDLDLLYFFRLGSGFLLTVESGSANGVESGIRHRFNVTVGDKRQNFAGKLCGGKE